MNEVREALRLLEKRRFVLAIHDLSFPSRSDEEIGRGTPYSRGAADFLSFVSELGFDGVQLGPQGLTTRSNPSPYDGALFSRNPLNMSLWLLAHDPAWTGLIDSVGLEDWVASTPKASTRSHHVHAFDLVSAALDEMQRRFRSMDRGPLHAALVDFSERERAWLESDAIYDVLERAHGGRHHTEWAVTPSVADARARTDEIERYALGQLILREQHAALRATARTLGLKLYGDFQVGLSPRDLWRSRSLFVPHLRLGAPPSRTNPEGQPWGYAVLDPDQYRTDDGRDGPALAFVRDRVGRLLDDFDGIRIDHPHGLVCPWVYDANASDPVRAVQNGGRLFSSPDRPELRAYAIADADQLDPLDRLGGTVPRHADDWVAALRPEQVDRYAILFDALVGEAEARGRHQEDIVCEVLSTQPNPLGWVLARHGLGRFRVTQKANPDDPRDVYRSQNARPEDWIMMSTHDTPPIWKRARAWTNGEGEAERRAQALGVRVSGLDPAAVARDAGLLVHAMAADLFVSEASHVMVFFADLFGTEETYNVPGKILSTNWSLRVPPDYETRYRRDVATGIALDIRFALALALRARGLAEAHPALVERLMQASSWRLPP